MNIENEADIIEEIVRIYGYDKIPSKSIYISSEKIEKNDSVEKVL